MTGDKKKKLYEKARDLQYKVGHDKDLNQIQDSMEQMMHLMIEIIEEMETETTHIKRIHYYV